MLIVLLVQHSGSVTVGYTIGYISEQDLKLRLQKTAE